MEIKLLDGQVLTGMMVMRIKTLLHTFSTERLDIVLRYHSIGVKVEIFNRKDFDDFIEKYGNKDFIKWSIECGDGVPCVIFDLKESPEWC